ncbi:ABC transporter substrate-binding protein [Solibacillus sp. FSL H8-0538]|uniref:ABC transporter substrate-binding protein n=1 Tax=Solibacillus sp. FSL H8-0538 TaxID=2921400 RepID=UPI0030F869BF
MKFKLKWLAPLAATLLLVACSDDKETLELSPKEGKTEDVVEEAGPYKVVDDRGVEVTFDEVPETIVSLQPSSTEILFSLGVGDKIIGATEYDTYPAEALEIERVSTSVTIDAERVVELNPDVVIAYSNADEAQITQLEDAGLKVFMIQSAASFEDVYSDVVQLSEVMGVEETGEKVIADVQAQIAAVQEKTNTLETKKKVYYEVSPAPDIWTAGSETFQHEILTAAGVDNVFVDQTGWLSVTEEDVITRSPETILTPATYLDDAVGEILSRAGWDTIQAVTNKEVYLVDGDVLSRPATRIGEAVELVAQTVYPDLFK